MALRARHTRRDALPQWVREACTNGSPFEFDCQDIRMSMIMFLIKTLFNISKL